METGQRRNFLAIVATNDDGSHDAQFVNLDAVRMVDKIGPGHIRLSISETHTMNINGPGAAWVLARIGDRSTTPNGEPLALDDDHNLAGNT